MIWPLWLAAYILFGLGFLGFCRGAGITFAFVDGKDSPPEAIHFLWPLYLALLIGYGIGTLAKPKRKGQTP